LSDAHADRRGHAAYGRAATDGLFDSRDLRIGEAVLMAAGFPVARDDSPAVSNHLTDAVGKATTTWSS
jgi:hypothetical protein